MKINKQRSKKHHFVARSVLERFRSEKRELWFFSAKRPRKVEHRNPENIFYENHDNTLIEGSVKDDSLERVFYQEHDQHWAKGTLLMIEMVKRGEFPDFAPKAKDALFEAIYKQFERSPDAVHDRYNYGFYYNAIPEIEKRLGFVPPELLAGEDQFEQTRRNILISKRKMAIDPRVLDHFRTQQIIFIHANDGADRFIIGSAVKCVSNGLIVVPLSKDVALALCPKSVALPKIIDVRDANNEIISDANVSMAKRSRWGIAGPDKDQIEQLATLCPKTKNH